MSTAHTTAAAAAGAEDVVTFPTSSNPHVAMYHLNRPRALNSLNQPMVDLLREKVDKWITEKETRVVVGRGEGRGFCAGGDVKQVTQDARASSEGLAGALDFFRCENELDYLLALLKTGKVPQRLADRDAEGATESKEVDVDGKTYIVFMDGPTMGGGAGLSYPAPLRIANESTIFAMPETKIGFAPDVGAQFYLSQLDGAVGAWLAVTGESLFGRALGIATHYIPKSKIAEVVAAIEALPKEELTTARLSALILSFSAPPTTSASEASTNKTPDAPSLIAGDVRNLLDRAFSKSTVPKVLAALHAAIDGKDKQSWSPRALEWAQQTIKTIGERSPTGMKIALLNWQGARKLRSLRSQLDKDLAMCCAFMTATQDMFAGVDQVLVHKSKEPAAWDPATLDDPRLEEGKLQTTWFDRKKSTTLDAAPELGLLPPTGGEHLWGTFRAWGLPSEQSVQEYITGSRSSSDAFALTRTELKQRLWSDLVTERGLDESASGVQQFKAEVEAKVEEVCERQCVLEGEGEAEGKKYLKWHPVAKL
ncbi:hypothetical protein QFC22_002551 [Naganishia vaughanmartiniae]|uniref:Uncharacterized protein n=1 Tax=Naganishia vaughanmartiniae TaxID=1424756 RepID=A0ACC2X9M7_9TREE|nr:hypothetical protein QFC22_002551 [Naganishia vaughanmartiniae]